MKSLLILGRQPALGLAELESLYGAAALRPVGPFAVELDLAPEAVDFGRLGGAIKLARVLETYPFTDWDTIEQHLTDDILDFIKDIPIEGKLRLGLSLYGLRARVPDVNKTGLTLKKQIKITGRSVRVIPNKFPELNSAQVLHNQLTGPTGCELVLFRDGTRTILARTVAEQDIEAYAARDQNRPYRDAKIGMLPPKLAQIIINLASKPPDPQPGGVDTSTYGKTLLDPFCGTGVLLQEAQLMGYDAYGTDLEPRMIDYSKQNLVWLNQKFPIDESIYTVETGDATSYKWSQPIDLVAGETYLGKPLTSLPHKEMLDQIMHECDVIHDKFLKNIGQLIPAGTRLCLAVPAWKTKTGFLHLKTLDYLSDLGYTRKKFEFAKSADLIYFRPDQTVARELVVLEKL